MCWVLTSRAFEICRLALPEFAMVEALGLCGDFGLGVVARVRGRTFPGAGACSEGRREDTLAPCWRCWRGVESVVLVAAHKGAAQAQIAMQRWSTRIILAPV